MPAFGGSLDSQQIWGLVLLLEDLGKEASGVDTNATAADIYAQRCAVCHGAKGAGDGPLAAELFPPPRDFVRAAYRFRSTKSGAAPLDTDIIGVSAHGLGDTAMGHFLSLGADRLEDVAHYLQSFAPAAFATTPPTLDSVPMPAEPMLQMAGRGREVYERAKCGDCHGPTGRGDGPSAATLKDDAGHPSVATDLTKRWLYKVGGGATDVFRTLASGLNGTPMGSFDPTLSSDDRWALAAYLERIARARPRYVPTLDTILVTEKIPDDPTAPFWKTIPPTLVPLGPQVEIPPYWTQPSIDMVEVVAAANADELGLLLVWNDASRNVDSQDAPPTSVANALARHGSWRLPDAVAVQTLSTVDPQGTRPPLYLGDASHPVVRWMWSADRQEHGETEATVQRIAGPTATPTTVDGVVVHATGRYVDGQWRVLLRTKRPPKTVAAIPFALHAWNGAVAEAGHWHSLSGWMNLSLR